MKSICYFIRSIRELKQRRQRPDNENATKQYVWWEKTIALYVRFEFWYISSPSSAKQQREMTKVKLFFTL